MLPEGVPGECHGVAGLGGCHARALGLIDRAGQLLYHHYKLFIYKAYIIAFDHR